MNEKAKHDHKGTKKLKILIFSLVMLAPFIAIGVKCAYAIKNENAKDSYKGSYAYESTYLIENTISNLTWTEYKTINTYYHSYISNENNNLNGTLYFKNISNQGSYNYCYGFTNIEILSTTLEINNLNNYKSFIFGRTDPNNNNSYTIKLYNIILTNDYYINRALNLYNSNEVLIQPSYTINVTNMDFDITFLNNANYIISYGYYTNNGDAAYLVDKLYKQGYIVDTTLSSVFYSAIQELDKASIFSWTTNTGTYTAVNNMCTTLGIISPPLAVLLTYWTLITVIYVIIDIVLESFIYLTHWINDKMI